MAVKFASWAERSSFRALMRICRYVDEEVSLVVPLIGRPPRLYHPDERKTVYAPASSTPWLDDAIWDACGGATEYPHPTGSASSAVRRYTRLRSLLLGSLDVAEMRLLGKQFLAARTVAVKVRAVPEPKGPLLGPQARPRASAPTPSTLWRLPARSRAPLRVGDFLLAHPLSGFFQPVFDMGVLLIVRVDSDSDTAQGLVLNKPTKELLKEAVCKAPSEIHSLHGEVPDALELFETDVLSNGGPVVFESLQDSLSWVHTHGVVPNSEEVAPDVFFGGDLSTLSAMESSGSRRGEARRVRLFRGFATWSLSQLDLELERGVWIRARASCRSAALELCLGSASTEAAWRSALEAVGLPALARFPRGPAVDNVLQDVVEAHQRARAEELLASGRHTTNR